MKKNNYSLHALMDIRFADPVSSLALNEKYVIYGTMMGRIAYLSLSDKKTQLIAELSNENITGITFESSNTFNISIGDEEVLKYRFDSNNHIMNEYNRIKIYGDDETDHKSQCDDSYIILSNKHVLRIYLKINSDKENNSSVKPPTLIHKSIINNNIVQKEELDISNYSVPFDYDGIKFVWIEYISESERDVCVFYFEQRKKWKYKIDKKFGHISHIKILPNEKLLLVRNLNHVEIRIIDDNFKVTQSFYNIGDEVIAVDVYYGYRDDLDNIHIKKNDDYIKVQEGKDKEMNMEAYSVSDENFSIILLDIDGNVNVWEKTISKKFNMYDIQDINIEYKKKQFFSMGYPYFIKSNKKFYAISSDHGVFVINKD